MAERRRISWLIHNPVTYAGAILAASSFIIIVFLLLFELVGGKVTTYLGVLVFVLMPTTFVVGLILIPVGMIWTRQHPPAAEAVLPGMRPFPVLDLNDPIQQRGFILWSAATLVFVGVLAGVSYRAYNFMDSTEFCGAVCHTVMKPEYVTYQHSPHARVTCTACHIGPGADWFVRAKISGTRQVFAVATNSYPRPIPVPISDLRPARETCETCHWPEKFYGEKLRQWTTYQLDEKNTPQQKSMVLKVGGTEAQLGYATGIHWHVSADNKITYAALDKDRQNIAWVRLEKPSGEAVEFTRSDVPVTSDVLAKAEKRTMDCMDCHNRPTHHIIPPGTALDASLTAKRIDPSLPFVKKKGQELLSLTYPDEASATRAIEQGLTSFYQTTYPDVYAAKQGAIKAAIAEMQQIYRDNDFPEMKVDYLTYGDNIGHQSTPGCFRCHDNKHVSPDGQAIRQDCDICHTPVTVKQ
ncbi:MAG: NapC/NirT family cytochrome c [Chloroflexi bacterium]|nr:NapC/NirT family cytochrome c [Chloroflexota bacterium]MCL5026156.1 NapC/NirT family cytochrome c [Chloroflexota bacterium]